MKTLAYLFWSAAVIVALNGSLHSEGAAAKTPLETLQQMKTQNAALGHSAALGAGWMFGAYFSAAR